MAPKKRAAPKRASKLKAKKSAKEKSARGLNSKQRLFAAEFCKDFNATQAAIRAGYSERSAYSIGHDLLKKPELAALIATTQEQLLKEAGVDAFRVLREVARVAFGDLRDVVRWDEEGNVFFTASDEISEDAAATLSEISHVLTIIPQKNAEPIERRQLKVKRYDKMTALKLLVEHLNLTNGGGPSVEQKANPLAALLVAIERSKERAAKAKAAGTTEAGG